MHVGAVELYRGPNDAKIDRVDKYWKMASEHDAKRCY